MAETLGISQIGISLVMSTAEVVVEFLASYCTPRFFCLLHRGEKIRARELSVFALEAYGVSSIVALVVYPVLGVVINILRVKSLATMTALIVAQNVQYSFINQVGDQAIEMARPHWLKTFEGLDLLLPAWQARYLGSDAEVVDARPRPPCFGVRKPATPRSLSIALTLMRLFLAVLFTVGYLLCRSSTWARWLSGIALSGTVALFAWLLRSGSEHAVRGIRNEEVHDESGDSVTPLCKLPAVDRKLVFFSVLIFSLPESAFNALLSLLVLRLSSIAYGVLLVVGVISITLYFAMELSGVHARHKEQGSAVGHSEEPTVSSDGSCLRRMAGMLGLGQSEVGRAAAQGSEFRTWLLRLWVSILSLSAGALLLFLVVDAGLLYIVVPALFPFLISEWSLRAKVDAFFFKYPEERSTAVQYWINVSYVIISGPLLAINWAVSAQSPDEYSQAASVISVAVLVVLSAAIYFQFFERSCEIAEDCVVSRTVDAITKSFALATEQGPSVAGSSVDGRSSAA